MVYLDDLLKSDDFNLAVSAIAKDFREKYKFPDIHQLGIVVPDVEAAAAELEAKGIGPFFIASSGLLLWRERGKPKNYRGKAGIGYYRGFELELLEPGNGSTFYKSCVDPDCKMVVQHLGFRVRDVDAHAKKLENDGHATWVRGKIKSFPLFTDFAYMDTRKKAGIILEFIDMRWFGLSIKMPAGIFHSLGRMEKIIGKRSLSF